MRAIRPFIAIVLMLASFTVFAQSREAAPIERQMTADEFKAAGLDKLSAEDRNVLSAAVNTLAEDLSALRGKLGLA